MKTISFSRATLLLAGLVALSCLAGCSRGPAAATPADVVAFKGDPSKMPDADRARMMAAQQKGSANVTQTRPPATPAK